MKVLLVSMPFGALDRPALGLSMLKAEVTKAGFACDVRYLNIAFAELIGCEEYRWLSSDLPYTAFAGDWTFTRSLYGPRPRSDAEYIDEILRHTWLFNEEDIARLLRIRELVPHFLDHCMRAVSWKEYQVVGFTSTFEQNIASLVLAKRLKAAFPSIKNVFGGANWEGEMGLALHRAFDFIDYVCSGEADDSFPALLRRLSGRRSRNQGAKFPPGVVHRVGGRSILTGAPTPVRDLDLRPIPDFSDYFAALDRSSAPMVTAPILVCETSRGCWWGAKSHCTFCGLNGSTMAFRRKSPARALEEILYLTERWRVPFIQFVDNILDMKYFDTVLAELAARRLPINFFYEVKANLERRHVQRLAEAGVRRIQPGIESMSDRILKLMRKGTTALRNIQLLKWCKEYGVEADWNVLYGFPGETRKDYDEMLILLRAMRFLGPPSGCGPLRLDRFSPYHSTPQAFGITDVRPLRVYHHLYPFAEPELAQIAYHFDFGYTAGTDPRGCFQEVVDYVAEWRSNPERGSLRAVARDGETLVLVDTRSDATAAEFRLTGAQAIIYRYCDEMRSLAMIRRCLAEQCPGMGFDENSLVSFLASLVDNRLMVSDGTNYLSLALASAPVVGWSKEAPATMHAKTPAAAEAAFA
jgi:ribosomal peptide maturation radical SAM protein 1